jgi:hypothetical protein
MTTTTQGTTMLLLGSGSFLATSMYVFAKFCLGC